jgi:hypothetical protein
VVGGVEDVCPVEGGGRRRSKGKRGWGVGSVSVCVWGSLRLEGHFYQGVA